MKNSDGRNSFASCNGLKLDAAFLLLSFLSSILLSSTARPEAGVKSVAG